MEPTARIDTHVPRLIVNVRPKQYMAEPYINEAFDKGMCIRPQEI
jgi:hypothetical protein